jgi:hypothetical protein
MRIKIQVTKIHFYAKSTFLIIQRFTIFSPKDALNKGHFYCKLHRFEGISHELVSYLIFSSYN